MVPFRDTGNLTEIQRWHNYRLSSDRVVIEHAIGLLKERWRRLRFIKTYSISKTIEVASSACVLHNFCLLNDDYWITEPEAVENIDPPALPMVNRAEENREAKIKRNRIASSFF